VSNAQAGSGAISETELQMQDMMDLLGGQMTGGGGGTLEKGGRDPNAAFFNTLKDFDPKVNPKYQVDLYGYGGR
ncbi:hypothetical protein LCGC14_2079240, partial [marine sediment metagenome]